MKLMTILFAFIIALSVATTHIGTQNISAIRGQTGNILNAVSVASVCNNKINENILEK
jgi:hypothetical protein